MDHTEHDMHTMSATSTATAAMATMTSASGGHMDHGGSGSCKISVGKPVRDTNGTEQETDQRDTDAVELEHHRCM